MAGPTVYRAMDLLTRRRVVRSFEEMRERDSWPPARLSGYVQERIERLLEHARSKVHRYREARLSGPAHALASYPLLGKEELRGDPGGLLADGVDRRKLMASSSGGSTGAPVPFWFDSGALDAQSATVLRLQVWMGLDPVCRHLLLWSPPPDEMTYTSLSGRLRGALIGRLTIHTHSLDDRLCRRIACTIERWRPVQVIGYPSVLDQLATTLPAPKHRPRAVVTAAEISYPAQRERIGLWLGTSVFERYGCNEFSGIAHTCRCGNIHVATDRVVLESLRPDGSPAGPGELGEAVVTDLDNFSMPLVRYRLGDAIVLGGSCGCGLPFPTLEAVHGRIQDLLHTPDGAVISPRQLAIAIASSGEILEHQCVVDSNDQPVELLIRGAGEIDITRAQRAASEMLGQNIPVRRVSNLPRWRSGKVRPVLRVGAVP